MRNVLVLQLFTIQIAFFAQLLLTNHPAEIKWRYPYSLQTCSYWYSYNDTMELIAGASEQIYHFEELINAGVV